MVSKTWCFTLNNYSEEELKALRLLPDITYLLMGKEVSSTGTPHIQGYITFKNAHRFSAMRKFSPRAHWEPTRVDAAANRYCRKDGDYEVIDRRRQRGPKPRALPQPQRPIPAGLFPPIDLRGLF